MKLTPLEEAIIKKMGKTVEEFTKEVEESEPILEPIHKKVVLLQERVETPEESYSQVYTKEDATIDELKLAKINLLKSQCTQAIYEGFTATNGHEYGFNAHDQANLTQQMILIIQDVNDEITSIEWKTKDEGVVNHTKADFNQVILDAKNHKLAQQQKYWNLEQQILDATDKDTIHNVSW